MTKTTRRMKTPVFLCFSLIAISGIHGFLFGDNEICCTEDGIGCFTKEGAFSHLPLPDCPRDMDLRIGMFTRENKYLPDYLTDGLPSSFNGKRRTIFIAHGYMSDYYTSWLHEMKDLVLDKEDANVVIVGWGEGASKIYYPQAASNTRTAGAAIAVIARNMREMEHSASLWCVGFSLGSHLCGHMGSRVHLNRITGLDPAGPSFDSYDIEAGLTPDRADLVDVIHTDGWGIVAYYGSLRPLGDVDYYPNEGYYQPGCLTRRRRDIIKKANTTKVMDDQTRVLRMIEYGQAATDGVAAKGEGLSCSHSRAPKYFMESIKQECFFSEYTCTDYNDLPDSCTKCSGGNVCGVMGYYADKYHEKGLLYHQTSGRVPYCPV